MGFGWQELLIILVIVALIFGTKKLRNIGSDLGGAVKSFKDSVSTEDAEKEAGDSQSEQLSDDANQTAEKVAEKATEKKDSVSE